MEGVNQNMNISFDFNLPTIIKFGEGRIKDQQNYKRKHTRE